MIEFLEHGARPGDSVVSGIVIVLGVEAEIAPVGLVVACDVAAVVGGDDRLQIGDEALIRRRRDEEVARLWRADPDAGALLGVVFLSTLWLYLIH